MYRIPLFCLFLSRLVHGKNNVLAPLRRKCGQGLFTAPVLYHLRQLSCRRPSDSRRAAKSRTPLSAEYVVSYRLCRGSGAFCDGGRICSGVRVRPLFSFTPLVVPWLSSRFLRLYLSAHERCLGGLITLAMAALWAPMERRLIRLPAAVLGTLDIVLVGMITIDFVYCLFVGL